MRKASPMMRIKNRLLGRPYDSARLERTKLSWFWGLPEFAGNAVSSVAYAVEEILLVLVPLVGFAAVAIAPQIALPIIILLLVLVFSYSQIIKHYPNGASAYHVASDTLGKRPAITAAAALIVDYTLTVAVSICAAVAALSSAFPAVAPYRVPLAVLCVFLITVFNLRGTQEASRIFGIPTYAFIVIMGVLITTGLFQLATGTLQPIAYTHPMPEVDPLLPAAMVFLLLRAFTAGSVALTGIESVNNSMALLREPRQKNAQIVLFTLGVTVLFLFTGAIILARTLEVVPFIDPTTGALMPGQLTVIAQMGQAIFGPGSLLFFVLQVSTALVLFVAAHSAYSDLPNLFAALARDGYVPHQFGERGAKLTLSNGIIFLFVAASGLVIAFNASVHALIPLYSVGVFLSFTISQTGMCVRWMREKEPHWKKFMAVNVLGAIMTGVALIIVFLAKFTYGAWVLAIVIPVIGYMMFRVRRHYTNFHQSLAITREDFYKHYRPSASAGTIDCYIPVNSITLAVLKNINFAEQLSHNVHLLHVSRDLDKEQRLIQQYNDFDLNIPLIILECPYRDLTTPIVNFLDREESKLCSSRSIAVITSRFTFDHYYDNLLHNQTTYFISRALRDYKDIAIVMVPFHLNLQRVRDSHVQTEEPLHGKNRFSKDQKAQRKRQALRRRAAAEVQVPNTGQQADINDANNADIRYRRVGYEKST